MKINKILEIGILSVLLVACGGGGGTSSPPASSSGSSSSTASLNLQVDAGPDIDVNEGESVSISIEVESEAEIVAHSASRVSGEGGSISLTDPNGLEYTFNAPDTVMQDSLEIAYEFTYEDGNGKVGSDTVVITVNRINDAPIVSLEPHLVVHAGEDIELSANADDPDGNDLTYIWVQTTSENLVDIGNRSDESISFVAPETDKNLELEFTVTVEDSDGASASASAFVSVIPKNAPDIDIHFPGKVSYSWKSELPISGVAKPEDGHSLVAISVSSDIETVEALINNDGSWRVDRLVIPTDKAFSEITVTAEDSSGRISIEKIKIYSQSASMPWAGANIVSMVVKENGVSSWLLMSEDDTNSFDIVSYDFLSGAVTEPVVSISVGGEDIPELDAVEMLYDEKEKRFFIASSPSFDSSMILLVDEMTGDYSVLSGAEKGEGPEFQRITGITLSSSGELFVVDEGLGSVMEVDISTGNRLPIAPEFPPAPSLLYSGDLEWDSANSRLLIVPFLSFSEDALLSVTDTSEGGDIESVSNVNNEGPDVDAGYREAAVDEENGRIFLVNNSQTELIEIDLSSGDRNTLVENIDINSLLFISDLTYSSVTKLLYLTQSAPQGRIFALDIESGVAVGIGTFP